MALELPGSMDELVYWTNRKVGKKGYVKAWVNRKECPECGKATMGKPTKDDGKVKIRASFYECPECGYKADKKDYEETLEVECIYTCPHCGNKGEAVFPYKRKSYKGVKALVFECGSCSEKIPITKKLKGINF